MSRRFGPSDMDMDMDMDMDAQGSSGGLSPVVRPIGVSPALGKMPDEDWYRGNKWPPQDLAIRKHWQRAQPQEFPRAYWTSHHFAITVLAEFVSVTDSSGQTKWNAPALTTELTNLLPVTTAIDQELDQLEELIEYRPGVMSEALAQRRSLWSYFSGILMCNSSSAPFTRDLVEIAGRVGQFQSMHYKRHFNRPRPAQYSPALLTPFNTPGHASFPSGHATEAFLIAMCLEKVMPAAACTPPPPPPPQTAPLPAPDSSPLRQMAQRMARNREVLGLHFPSDSAAGKLLAERTFAILMQCKTINDPQKGIIARAAEEWS